MVDGVHGILGDIVRFVSEGDQHQGITAEHQRKAGGRSAEQKGEASTAAEYQSTRVELAAKHQKGAGRAGGQFGTRDQGAQRHPSWLREGTWVLLIESGNTEASGKDLLAE